MYFLPGGETGLIPETSPKYLTLEQDFLQFEAIFCFTIFFPILRLQYSASVSFWLQNGLAFETQCAPYRYDGPFKKMYYHYQTKHIDIWTSKIGLLFLANAILELFLAIVWHRFFYRSSNMGECQFFNIPENINLEMGH